MGYPNCSAHALRRWLLLSFALHALLLLIFGNFLPSTARTAPRGVVAMIEATLRSTPKAPPVLINESSEAPRVIEASPRLAVPASSSTRTAQIKLADVGGSPARLSIEETLPVVSGVAGGEASAAGEPPAPIPAPLSLDGLREYRLNLGREARRYRRYPALARERGLEGVTVIVISTRAGFALPQVSLGRSSGHLVLDTQALEMVALAVGAASLPESLRGRDFGLDLPIRFSLEE